MGSCCAARDAARSAPGGKPDDFSGGAPSRKKRDSKYYYEITFNSRPLYITLTSTQDNTDGYITNFKKVIPIKDAEKKITLNSKVIKINGMLVEGCDITEIARILSNQEVPIKMLLAHPDGLKRDEVPDLDPKNIVNVGPKKNRTNLTNV